MIIKSIHLDVQRYYVSSAGEDDDEKWCWNYLYNLNCSGWAWSIFSTVMISRWSCLRSGKHNDLLLVFANFLFYFFIICLEYRFQHVQTLHVWDNIIESPHGTQVEAISMAIHVLFFAINFHYLQVLQILFQSLVSQEIDKADSTDGQLRSERSSTGSSDGRERGRSYDHGRWDNVKDDAYPSRMHSQKDEDYKRDQGPRTPRATAPRTPRAKPD